MTNAVNLSSVAATGFLRNRIINGDFSIWQRGTSFTSSGVNEYSADRWRTEGWSLNSVISRQAFTAGQTAVPGYPTYFCRVTTSSAPSGYWAFQQRLECPQNMNGDGTYTVSFWAKAVSGTIPAGTFTYGIDNDTYASNPALTTTWQKITFTQTLSGVLEAAGYISLYVVRIGSGVSSLSVDIANVQLEVGSVATPFEREIYSQTLAKCQRYYLLFGGVVNNFGVQGYSTAGNNCSFYFHWPIPMRASPTVTLPTLSNSNTSGIVANNPNQYGVLMAATASGTGAISSLNTGGGSGSASAEL